MKKTTKKILYGVIALAGLTTAGGESSICNAEKAVCR